MVGICLVLITTRDEITEFLWEPLPDQGQLFAKLIEAKFFSKVDLSKGNYQLPVKKKRSATLSYIQYIRRTYQL